MRFGNTFFKSDSGFSDVRVVDSLFGLMHGQELGERRMHSSQPACLCALFNSALLLFFLQGHPLGGGVCPGIKRGCPGRELPIYLSSRTGNQKQNVNTDCEKRGIFLTLESLERKMVVFFFVC